MSREIRRVPVGWQHPTEPNPYWRNQVASAIARRDSLSRLRMPQVRFIGLLDDYVGALASWEQERADYEARQGSSWKFNIEYHLTGYRGHDDDEPSVHPFYGWEADGNTETSTPVRDEDHLHELVMARHADERPDPAHYMPSFDGDADALGWCLYETVSEGTPITPVFATAQELIDHLATEGDDWKQEPWRREAAEAMVSAGWAPTFLARGNDLMVGGRDADRMGGAS